MSSLIKFQSHMLMVVPRRTWVKKVRPFEERMRETLDLHKNKRLVLAQRKAKGPDLFQTPPRPPKPIIETIERKLPSLQETKLPYAQYDPADINNEEKIYGTYYDPLFNPNLYEERHRVNPDQEPFNAIYQDSKSEARQDYTQVRNITSPELWSYVERLERLKVAPPVRRRKADEPIQALPSGFVPPPETPPDLPYFIARTRNHLLPVYYQLNSDPNECKTIIKFVTGNIWQFEEELRTHLESVTQSKRRILSSVQEPDERVEFRGRYLHEVADWLYAQGF